MEVVFSKMTVGQLYDKSVAEKTSQTESFKSFFLRSTFFRSCFDCIVDISM